MDARRPKQLAYRAKSGIYDVHFEHDKRDCREFFRDFIARAMHWADSNDEEALDPSKNKNEYRILDSFFSDSFERSDVAAFIKSAKKHSGTVKFLLANPYSEFAKARAKSIVHPHSQGDPESEMRKGLLLILHSMNEVFGITSSKQWDKSSLIEIVSYIQNEGTRHRIELRFYNVFTGGPLIFFRDILLTGRYDFGISSIALPWNMIVNDIFRDYDLFDMHWNVFDKIWSEARKTFVEEYTLCICFTTDQRSVADDLDAMLRSLHLNIVQIEHEASSCTSLDANKLPNMSGFSDIVFICSLAAIGNKWFYATLGAALALGKITHPILAGGLTAEFVKDWPLPKDATLLNADRDGLNNLAERIHAKGIHLRDQ